MNALPSMMVLDFCEWLKNRGRQQQGENYNDMFDLILNDEYRGKLIQLAEEYLQGGGNSMRKLLHSFIDSKEFDSYLAEHCPLDIFNEWNDLKHYPEYIHDFFYYCLSRPGLGRAFERFIRRSYDEAENGYTYYGDVTPRTLADSVKYYFAYQKDEPFVMHMMTGLSTDLSLEIDFLEWLMQYKGKPLDLKRMKPQFFEILADEYCKYANRSSEDKRKLIKAFKQSDTVSLGKKLVAVLSNTQAERMKGLGYIYDRYVSEKVPFRCLFLPVASDGDAFKEFIKKHWLDLHSMTGNHLDIYYSKEDFGKSGYAIKDGMRMASKYLPGTLPCIVIWQDNLKFAQAIDIQGLSDEEVVRLIAKIVDLIKLGETLDTISSEAKKMTEEIRQAHVDANRPISNTTFNVENNTGVIAGYIQDSKVTVYGGSITNPEFESETEKAIEIINTFSSVEREYREFLIALVKEANVATQSGDEAAKSDCKNTFNGFMHGAGKAVSEIITKLSELATIAGFFGLTASVFLP